MNINVEKAGQVFRQFDGRQLCEGGTFSTYIQPKPTLKT